MSERVLETIASDERLKKIIREIIDVYSKGFKQFRYYEIGIQPHEASHYIRLLTRIGLIKVSGKTHNATYYTPAMPIEQIKMLLEMAEKVKPEEKTVKKRETRQVSTYVPPSDLGIPEEIVNKLFTSIEGHEKQKEAIKSALVVDKPVHILLAGPPATAKSLILLDIAENIPDSVYILGSTSSKAGIRDLIIEQRPRILLIDEIDKINNRELDILLSIMETGVLVVTKHTFRANEKIWVKVFAACNNPAHLSKPLLSRFLLVEFKEYSEEEYIKVVEKVLVERENLSKEIASLIASELSKYTRDPRDAVLVGRMVGKTKDVEQAKKLIKILAPSIQKKYKILAGGFRAKEW